MQKVAKKATFLAFNALYFASVHRAARAGKEKRMVFMSGRLKQFLSRNEGSKATKVTQTNELERVDNFGRTPLMTAAYKNDMEAIKRLLASGANIHSRQVSGNTAPAWAPLTSSA